MAADSDCLALQSGFEMSLGVAKVVVEAQYLDGYGGGRCGDPGGLAQAHPAAEDLAGHLS